MCDDYQFKYMALNVLEFLKHIKNSNCQYKINKKNLCKNMLSNKFKYNKNNCIFHFLEINEIYQTEALKLKRHTII